MTIAFPFVHILDPPKNNASGITYYMIEGLQCRFVNSSTKFGVFGIMAFSPESPLRPPSSSGIFLNPS